jgi:membrane associated rhomboid family serine protease
MARYDTSRFGPFGAYMPTPWVKRLLIANAVIFLVMWIGRLENVFINSFGFEPASILLRPWSIATYTFIHGGIGHLFWNMLILFFFGPALEQEWGGKKFLTFFFLCAAGGAALSFVSPHVSVIGASGAILGLMLAFAWKWPHMPLHLFGVFPVPTWAFVGFLSLVSVMNVIRPDGSNTAHWAHFGGLIFAAAYLEFVEQSRIFRRSKSSNPVQGFKKLIARRRFKVVPGASTPPREPPRARRREERGQEEIDRVLDKISKQGMASLTPDEVRLLEEVSRRYRQN